MAEKEQTKLWTPVFRVSFPNVFKARKVNENNPNEKAKFSLSMIFPKVFTDAGEQKLFEAMRAAVSSAGEKKFGTDRSKWPTKAVEDGKGGLLTVSAIRSPWNDGAKKTGKEGYGPDVIYASATSEIKPGIVGLNRVIDPVTGREKLEDITEPSKFYAGCYARATLAVYAYDWQGTSKGVAFGLRSLQFIRDGEPLGGGTSNAADDFDSITPPSGAPPAQPAAVAAAAGGGFGV